MASRTAYVFVFEGFADWEPASALAELRRTFGFLVKTFALTTHPIMSMGGLKITPDGPLKEIQSELPDILILPGGDVWMGGEVEGITELIEAVHQAVRPIAAICADSVPRARGVARRSPTYEQRRWIHRQICTHIQGA